MLGALAYPRLGWWLLAWVFLAPAFALALARPPRAALRDGWLAGTAFFVVLLSWLDHTFTHYSAIPWPVSWLPIAALAAYCGLYVGLVCLGLSLAGARLSAAGRWPWRPSLWVAGEWIRGWLMDGFPWGLVGYSQHSALAVIQIADLAGVYGVSFVVVAANAALAAVLALAVAPGRSGRRGRPRAPGRLDRVSACSRSGRLTPPRPCRWP